MEVILSWVPLLALIAFSIRVGIKSISRVSRPSVFIVPIDVDVLFYIVMGLVFLYFLYYFYLGL